MITAGSDGRARIGSPWTICREGTCPMADVTIELLKAQLPAVAAADDGPRVRETGAGRRRDQPDLCPVLAPLDRARAGGPRRQRGRDADQERGIPGR